MRDFLPTFRCRCFSSALLLVAGGLIPAPVAADSGARALPVRGPWVSPPLATVPPVAIMAFGERELREMPSASRAGGSYGSGATSRPGGVREEDPLVALSRLPAIAASPAPRSSFAGLENLDGLYPPDANGAVGPSHYVQVVNVSFAVFSKSGALLGGPWNTNQLWAAATGSTCATDNDGSAQVLYDESASRWVVTQAAVTSAWAVCFAVSQSADPLGSYYLYEVTAQRFPGAPKVGVWPDSTYGAYTLATSSQVQGQYDVYAVDRSSMLAGAAARPAQYFPDFPNFLMPADLDGPTPPPTGTGGLFYSFRDGGEPYFGTPPSDSLDLYELRVNWTTPASSTFTEIASFTPAAGGLAPFNWTVCGFQVRNCLPQPGTVATIDSASWWPMPRLVYRNYGTHETIAGTWTVDATGTPNLAAPRWFELRRTGGIAGAWSIHQQGTHAPDGAHRWIPSLALDRDGNLALGYNVVDATSGLHPSIRYATRAPGDPAGTLQAEQTLQTGTGAQTASTGGWGEYASMSIDPVDDCTFWLTGEYLETTGTAPWKTRIGSFRVAGCGGLEVTPTSQAVCASAGSVSYSVTLSGPFTGTTQLSATGCPAGALCSFAPNPVVSPATASTFTVSNLGAVTSGSSSIQVIATDSGTPSVTANETVTLAVTASSPATPTLLSPLDGVTQVPTTTTLTWSAAVGATSYSVVVDDDPAFGSPFHSSTLAGTSVALSGLALDTIYYWRVTATNLCGETASATFDFRTYLRFCLEVNAAIPDGNPAGLSTSLPVSAAGRTITDLDLVMTGTHSWVGDLIVDLSNGTTTVRLVDRPGIPASSWGCGENDFDTVLDDEAIDPVEAACAPFPSAALAGPLQPNHLLSAFDGAPISGTWTLKVIDAQAEDVGILQRWCLSPTLFGLPALIVDAFESGTLSAWSAHLP